MPLADKVSVSQRLKPKEAFVQGADITALKPKGFGVIVRTVAEEKSGRTR